jgi:hypothetical protein
MKISSSFTFKCSGKTVASLLPVLTMGLVLLYPHPANVQGETSSPSADLCTITPSERRVKELTVFESKLSHEEKYRILMRQGYSADDKKCYPVALEYFQDALLVKPGDPYALQAIENMQSYLRRD